MSSISSSATPDSPPETLPLPILYSLQNCPYAMRARLAILLSQQRVQLRPITMKDKPEDMLLASPKGTVPVLIVKKERKDKLDGFDPGVDGKEPDQVVEESLDVMLWALKQNDPENLLFSHDPEALTEMLNVITENDDEFKPSLEKYKRAKRFHGDDLEECRLECAPFVQRLEQRLTKNEYFMGATPSLLDYALLPFIRQFSRVNKAEFADERYANLRVWLANHLQSRLFSRAMFKYPLWLVDFEVCVLGE